MIGLLNQSQRETGMQISGCCWVGEGMRCCATGTTEAEEGASGCVIGKVGGQRVCMRE